MNSEEFLIETNLGITTVNGQTIKASINKLIDLVQDLGEDRKGNLALEEVSIAIKINAEGQVILLGNGSHSPEMGTMTLRFKPTGSILASPSLATEAKTTQKSEQLVSSSGINYTNLRNLLAKQDWQAANQETWDLMCQMLHKNKGSYLSADDIKQLPCQDLQLIDRLWQQHSQGKFGFATQKQIYDSAITSK